MSKITPRILALTTVASVVTIAAVSGAVAAWSPITLSGQQCDALTTDKYGYGYGYEGAAGYGFDCVSNTTAPKSTSTSGGGGVSGGSSSSSSSNNTVAITPAPNTALENVRPTTTIFNNFTKKCENSIKDLTDSRLSSFYNEINVINQSNLGRALTRAEFLKLVLNAAKVDVTGETTSPFADTPTSHSLYQYVAYAHKIGMVSGQNGNFRPNDTITRAEAAKVFVNAANINLSTEIKTFADVSASNTLAAYIQTAYDNCILHGRKTQGGESMVANRVYEPNANITLAETAKILYNIVK